MIIMMYLQAASGADAVGHPYTLLLS